MMTEQCFRCKHYIRDSEYLVCFAFPDGIPENILTGEFDHTKKHPEQENDITFEPIEQEENEE